MKNRRITLIVAVVLAVATGVLTLRYLAAINQQSQQQAVVMKPIVIASVDIPARTKLRPEMLTKVMRAATTIEPGAIVDPKDAEGDIALITIPQGSPLTQSKVGVPASIGITARLRPGQRAVSIPVDSVKSVSGLIQPGDRVDVMASTAAAGTRAPHTASIIRGAMVLAVNQTIDPNGATPAPGAPAPGAPGTVTLAVTAAQADLLTVADINTNLRLALRSPDEAARSLAAEPLDLTPAASSAASGPQAAPASPQQPAQSAVRNAPPADGVIFIDGDKTATVAR